MQVAPIVGLKGGYIQGISAGKQILKILGRKECLKKDVSKNEKKREIVLVFSMERSIFGRSLASLLQAGEENKIPEG